MQKVASLIYDDNSTAYFEQKGSLTKSDLSSKPMLSYFQQLRMTGQNLDEKAQFRFPG